MAPSRTRTVKNKHAGSKPKFSKDRKSVSNGPPNGVVNAKKSQTKVPITSANKGRPKLADLLKKKKNRVYSEKELGLPKLNSVLPAGVQKPKGKKRGKVFVDDMESLATIMAIVQAEKEGQVESKMMKARQMEEIREARRVEAEKRDAERRERLEETKKSLRKKRKRRNAKDGGTEDLGGGDDEVDSLRDVEAKAGKSFKKRKVSFVD